MSDIMLRPYKNAKTPQKQKELLDLARENLSRAKLADCSPPLSDWDARAVLDLNRFYEHQVYRR